MLCLSLVFLLLSDLVYFCIISQDLLSVFFFIGIFSSVIPKYTSFCFSVTRLQLRDCFIWNSFGLSSWVRPGFRIQTQKKKRYRKAWTNSYFKPNEFQVKQSRSCTLVTEKTTPCKIPKFHLFFWCYSFAEIHRYRKITTPGN